jgi:GNAT superfamily N-acetyltransferase
MKIRAAVATDAKWISDMIRSLSHFFLVSPDGTGAEAFFKSINEDSIRRYIKAENFACYVAEIDDEVAGVVAIRDYKHLFHLFVAPKYQGRGVGRQLWTHVQREAIENGNKGQFTVNASLNAIPVYLAFGFTAAGEVVESHSVSFLPMRMLPTKNSEFV